MSLTVRRTCLLVVLGGRRFGRGGMFAIPRCVLSGLLTLTSLASESFRMVLGADSGRPALLKLLNPIAVKISTVPLLVGSPGALQPVRVVLSGCDALAVTGRVKTEGVIIPERLYVGPRLLSSRGEGMGVFREQAKDYFLLVLVQDVPCPRIEKNGLDFSGQLAAQPGPTV